MPNWWLFVDESGDFDDDEAQVIVAGLLVGQRNVALPQGALYAALRRAVPFMPWPPHAAIYNRRVAHALVSVAIGELSDLTALKVVDELRVAGLSALVDRALDDIRGLRRLHQPDLRAMEDVLYERAPRLMVELRARVQKARATIGAALCNAAEGDGDLGLYLFLAGESASGLAADPEVPDRYLSLLQAMLDRVARALGRLGEQHHVQLEVLGRDIRDPQHPKRSVPLRARDVRTLCNRLSYLGNQVAFDCGLIHEYDHQTHPLLVGADLVANRSAPLTGPWPLAELEGALRVTLRLPFSMGQPPRTNVAAAGTADHYLRVLGGAAAPPPPSLSDAHPWAREQAEQWAKERLP